MKAGVCVICKVWAAPAVVTGWEDTGSGPGLERLVHEGCLEGRRAERVRSPLPRRVRSDTVRRVIDARPPAPEVAAAFRAALPRVPVVSGSVRRELFRIRDRLARLVDGGAR